MAQDEYTFPQDFGTGDAYTGQEGDKGDANDAARLGALVGATKPVSCLLRGCTFSNVGSGSFDIDAGKFYAVADNLGVASGSEDRDEVGHVNGYSGDTGVSYTDNDVNYIFLEADLDQKEVITPVVNTNNTAPSGPSVKIGEIDATTSPPTTSEQWNLLAEDGTLSYPDADAANTALNNFDASVTVYDRTNNTLISDSGVSVPTLEADNATIGGVDVPDGISNTRNAVNQLFIENARQDFELGLSILEMDDGQFEVYANDNRIADQSNVNLNLGSALNGKGTVSLASNATSGFTEHDKEDYGFMPDSVWITDDIDTDSANGSIEYEIEDENGNVVTVTQSDTEASVDVSNVIETYAVKTRAVLKRDTDSDTSPVLDAYSAYISGQTPDDYLEATVTGVIEA